ncbi:MBL fold metallo-hydrolase [Microvirga sp. BT688]|uniref:MBL fold metallo-hydrolase n=1 Tax=Microvirga sp. TaxID=1873136 RepID=UPI001685A77A|nr:MBL fold metallo-hydrolase [Microvirga sp.]MBD2749525.1 MBL fold metallo-hydrolase [Microvirga sp.]
MAFLTESTPERGVASEIVPGIRRIVARNPSLMTYHGTNTYLIPRPSGFIVIDPGPDDSVHVNDVLLATEGRVSTIILSHSHSDHRGACAALKEKTGAPVVAFHASASPEFSPDIPLQDGDEVEGMIAIHTPGHASDHLCFARPDGLLFSADHVMSWSSTIVSPPDGDMADYCTSLQILLNRGENIFLPGHGPPIHNPKPYVASLLSYRTERERAIVNALNIRPFNTWDLVDRLYSKTDPWLRMAAERNVVAHLLKLQSEGKVEEYAELWRPTSLRRAQAR